MSDWDDYKKDHYSELLDEFVKVTHERDVWRAVCCVGLAAILILNFLGW